MEWTCWVFLAYLIHDTFHMLMTWKFTKLKSMLLHHISFGIVSFIGAEIFGRPGYHSDTEVVTEIVTEITYILQLTDSSTIFLNARWIVAVVLCNGKPKSIFAKLSLAACSILFSALYLVFRYTPIYSCYRSNIFVFRFPLAVLIFFRLATLWLLGFF